MSIYHLLNKISHWLVFLLGFILSPLSWWNDLVVNFPLAYIMAMPFGLINHNWFLPAFIVGYWITNILGLLLLHFGGQNILTQKKQTDFRIELKKTFFWSSIYSLVIIILVVTGILTTPAALLEQINKLNFN